MTQSERIEPGSGPSGPIDSDPNPGLLRALLHTGYDLLWLAAIALSSPWWVLRCLRVAPFRRMMLERFTVGLESSEAACILVHGVSVGEVKGAVPLVRALAERFHGLDEKGQLAALFGPAKDDPRRETVEQEEGWILGA